MTHGSCLLTVQSRDRCSVHRGDGRLGVAITVITDMLLFLSPTFLNISA